MQGFDLRRAEFYLRYSRCRGVKPHPFPCARAHVLAAAPHSGTTRHTRCCQAGAGWQQRTVARSGLSSPFRTFRGPRPQADAAHTSSGISCASAMPRAQHHLCSSTLGTKTMLNCMSNTRESCGRQRQTWAQHWSFSNIATMASVSPLLQTPLVCFCTHNDTPPARTHLHSHFSQTHKRTHTHTHTHTCQHTRTTHTHVLK